MTNYFSSMPLIGFGGGQKTKDRYLKNFPFQALITGVWSPTIPRTLKFGIIMIQTISMKPHHRNVFSCMLMLRWLLYKIVTQNLMCVVKSVFLLLEGRIQTWVILNRICTPWLKVSWWFSNLPLVLMIMCTKTEIWDDL